MQVGCFLDADEDKRRVERDGGEGVDGNAKAMLPIAGRHNGYASRKAPHHLAKIRLADVHRAFFLPGKHRPQLHAGPVLLVQYTSNWKVYAPGSVRRNWPMGQGWETTLVADISRLVPAAQPETTTRCHHLPRDRVKSRIRALPIFSFYRWLAARPAHQAPPQRVGDAASPPRRPCADLNCLVDQRWRASLQDPRYPLVSRRLQRGRRRCTATASRCADQP